MIRTVLAAALMAVAVAAYADEPAITITNAWARATPGGAKTGAAYLTITNRGGASDKLVSASTPVAGMTQLHTTIDDNGVMKMRPLKSLDVKPGGSATLKPGGMHLMLMDLKGPLKEGQSFPLALTFDRAGKIETNVMVMKAGAMGDMGNMPGMDMK